MLIITVWVTAYVNSHDKSPDPSFPVVLTAEQEASKSRHTQTQQTGDHDKDQQLQGLFSQQRTVLWSQKGKGQGQNKQVLASIWGISRVWKRWPCVPQGSTKLRYSLCPLLARVTLVLCSWETSSWNLGFLCSLSLGILKLETKWGMLPDNSLLNLWKATWKAFWNC